MTVHGEMNTTALALVSDLERAGALTETSLALPAETTYETWEAVGVMLGKMAGSLPWLIGDWYVFGEAAYGTRAEGARIFGVSVDTISNYASVARRIPPQARLAEPLTFTHHQQVAPLPAKERDRWLKTALKEGLTTSDLRARLIAAKAIERKAKEAEENGDATPLYTPREALTAIRGDKTWREIADVALEQLDHEIECPHCHERFKL